MTDYTTIRVSKDAKAEAQEAKRDGETWNEYLQRCTETPPNVQEFVPVEEVVGREVPQSSVDLSDVHTKLDRIDGALGDTVEKALEIGDSRNAVQLEATEYSKIADELEGRLR